METFKPVKQEIPLLPWESAGRVRGLNECFLGVGITLFLVRELEINVFWLHDSRMKTFSRPELENAIFGGPELLMWRNCSEN